MGVEVERLKAYDAGELLRITVETDEKLARASFDGARRLWFQLEAQY